MAHMYIINPLSGARMDNLFSTHPNVENRIAALQQIAAQMGSARPAPRGSFANPAPRGSFSNSTPSGASWRVPSTGRRPASDDQVDNRGPWG